MQVNYLHKGAAKVWYCVPPSAAPKFDAMARTLFPEAAAACPSFMRHKDVVISPKVLKSFNVPYIQAKQKAGEFIVLNAAAYHAGFNLGFNCAEAVNFALPSWLDVGREFVPCECGALPEGVQLDLSIFFPGIYDDSEEESAEESESEEGSEEESEEEEEETNSRMSRKRRRGASSDSEGDVEATPPPEKRPVRVRTPKVPEAVPSSRAAAPRGSVHATWGPVAEPRPVALVDRWPDTGELFFQLVHRLGKRSSVPGALWVGQLREEDEDGLFRPTGGTKLVHLGVRYPKLVHVRTEWTPGEGRQRLGGWKLITTDKRILM